MNELRPKPPPRHRQLGALVRAQAPPVGPRLAGEPDGRYTAILISPALIVAETSHPLDYKGILFEDVFGYYALGMRIAGVGETRPVASCT